MKLFILAGVHGDIIEIVFQRIGISKLAITDIIIVEVELFQIIVFEAAD